MCSWEILDGNDVLEGKLLPKIEYGHISKTELRIEKWRSLLLTVPPNSPDSDVFIREEKNLYSTRVSHPPEIEYSLYLENGAS